MKYTEDMYHRWLIECVEVREWSYEKMADIINSGLPSDEDPVTARNMEKDYETAKAVQANKLVRLEVRRGDGSMVLHQLLNPQNSLDLGRLQVTQGQICFGSTEAIQGDSFHFRIVE